MVGDATSDEYDTGAHANRTRARTLERRRGTYCFTAQPSM
jgi:hypothetical protein